MNGPRAADLIFKQSQLTIKDECKACGSRIEITSNRDACMDIWKHWQKIHTRLHQAS